MDAPPRIPCLAAAALLLAGCSAEVAPSYEDPVPQARIGALGQTAAARRDADLAKVIEDLDHNDAAVRLAAIGTLQRLTGQTLGYRFNAPAEERAASIARWKAWLAARGDRPASPAVPLPSPHGVPPA